MKKLQAPLTIIALLAIFGTTNYFADLRAQKAEEQRKKVEAARREAEAKALAAKDKDASHEHMKPAFDLPANTGPKTAPVKLEVFINNGNSCHSKIIDLGQVQADYGNLLRIEWLSMMDPKAAERSDKLEIGCEAGLVINGKTELEVQQATGKTLVNYRGPVGDKFRMSEVYAGINTCLKQKGKTPPAAAVKKAQ